MALMPPGIALPQVKAGKLKAIGLTSGRSALAPDIPPLAEAGVQTNFNLEVWTALVGPANLSKAAQDRLAREVPRIIRDDETRQKLFNQGWQARGQHRRRPAPARARRDRDPGRHHQVRGIKIE